MLLAARAPGCAPRAAARGCSRADARTLRFWAMGREGEVVRELVPEFEREHPASASSVQQIPWTAAHEKLLTAFVGDATPDVAQLGNTWIPEFVGARRARAARRARRRASTASRRATTSPASGTPTWSTGACYGVPWYVDTRVLFYRRDLLARRRLRRAAAHLGRVARRCWRDQARGRGRARYADPAAAQRVRAAAGARPAAGRAAAARRRPLRQLPRAAASGARSTSTSSSSRAAWRRAVGDTRDRATSTRSSPRLLRVLHHRAVEPRRVRRRLPADAAGRAGRPRRCPAPTARACRSPAARAWSCSARSPHQAGGVAARRVPVAGRAQQRFYRAHRRPAAAAQRVDAVRRWRRTTHGARLPRPARARAAVARRCRSGSGSRRRCSSWPSARCAGRCRSTQAAAGSSTRARTACWRSGAGCWRMRRAAAR